ncbi:uroporphyrinogen decarboxylase family protein [Pseudohalocynthiibacter aestuariivivens]|uniref:Uroporphyrinogen decarboxylase family protein n=1 Tax=Pseudohalocynthiibacter aestuariivivens TaxID=1591409 RepID=A0ABV5JF01_9RHOB|nr:MULTISPECIES: uroporphyrinogen decarboxylase family protein [Pseudohalocynthiibacter]MBS9717043.1 hypothetical protein [Pseudohalocynthiibacter aestuariivivens]
MMKHTAQNTLDVTSADVLEFPNGIRMLQAWQDADATRMDELKQVFLDTVEGKFDSDFAWNGPTDAIHIGGSINLMTLTIMHDLFGYDSSEFYKGNPERYVRTTLMTRRLLGMNKLYLSWPVYAFTAEAMGQQTMYPDKFPPGSDPDLTLLNRENWQQPRTPDFTKGIPAIIEEMIRVYVSLTGLEPVLHLSAPYSLAADTFGQEPLLAALVREPEFAKDLLRHLADTVHRPWINDFISKFPNGWIELSDASGSPFFVGPRNCRDISIDAIRYLAKNEPWGDRVYDANYRGDYVTQAQQKNRCNARKGGTSAATNPAVTLDELTEAKHSVCRHYVQRLHDDRVPVDYYRDKAIEWNVPLFAGVGSSQIDRNSVADMDAAKADLRSVTRCDVDAVKTVARTIRDNGYSITNPPWPGTIYFEDVSSESSMELIEVIVQTALNEGRY